MSHFIHGDNIEAKTRKKESEKNKSLLGEIRPKYEKWKKDMLEINGNFWGHNTNIKKCV